MLFYIVTTYNLQKTLRNTHTNFREEKMLVRSPGVIPME